MTPHMLGTIALSLLTPAQSPPPLDRPSVTSVLPLEGSEIGGNRVVVRGHKLKELRTVWFNDRFLSASDLSYSSELEMSFSVPAFAGLCLSPMPVEVYFLDSRDESKVWEGTYTYQPLGKRWDVEPLWLTVPKLDWDRLPMATASYYPWRTPGLGAPLGSALSLRNRIGFLVGLSSKKSDTRTINNGPIGVAGVTYRLTMVNKAPLGLSVGVLLFQRSDRRRSRPELFVGLNGALSLQLLDWLKKHANRVTMPSSAP